MVIVSSATLRGCVPRAIRLGRTPEAKTWDVQLAAGELFVSASDLAPVDGVAAAPAVGTIHVIPSL